jgi:hypothetical protein
MLSNRRLFVKRDRKPSGSSLLARRTHRLIFYCAEDRRTHIPLRLCESITSHSTPSRKHAKSAESVNESFLKCLNAEVATAPPQKSTLSEQRRKRRERRQRWELNRSELTSPYRLHPLFSYR